MANKRLAAVKAELEEVSQALKKDGIYLGISGGDLTKYANALNAKELMLQSILQLQEEPLNFFETTTTYTYSYSYI